MMEDVIEKLKGVKRETEIYRWQHKGQTPFYETVKKGYEAGYKKKKRKKKKDKDEKERKPKTKAVGPWGPSMFDIHE